MDFRILELVIDELSGILPGSKLERIYQGPDGGIYFLLHRDRETLVLLISPDRALPRIHLVAKKPSADNRPAGFILYLRGNLVGARVARISILDHDRIVEIRFTRTGSEHRLIFEVFNSSPNLILTDEGSIIRAVYNPVPPGEHGKRLLLAGATYVPPLKRSPDREERLNAGKQHAFDPDPHSRRPVNRGAELFYARREAEQQVLTIQSKISSLLKKTLAKTERRIAAVSNDLESAEKAEEYRKSGDLILANRMRLRTGMERIELTDYDGKKVQVKLDPRYSPARNAELYFKKYKKAKKGISIVQKRLDQAGIEELYLRNCLDTLGSIHDPDELNMLWSELVSQYGEKQTDKSRKHGGVKSSAPAFHRFIHEGWEIFVGKSAAGNEYVTFRLARPQDLWLHAEGMPGSHVIVRNPNAADVPPAVLQKAAGLAAYFSKGRTAGKVPVTYTLAKFVKKPKGVPLGTVTLSRRETIMIRPEAE